MVKKKLTEEELEEREEEDDTLNKRIDLHERYIINHQDRLKKLETNFQTWVEESLK